jgi:predicted dehydrogenase
MSVGFGIIGCGNIADFHARAIADLPDATLVGATSRSSDSAARFASQHGCAFFDSVEALVDSDSIDAVSVCTPSGAHLEPAVLAAAAGKHVVVEKPLEITVERCDRLIAACRDHGVLLSTIFQSRFHDASRHLKSAVQQGRFGQLALANAYVKWFRTQEYYDSGAWRGTWQLDGGGALMNQAIHNVDLLQWIMGPIQEITAFTATLAHQRIDVEDTAVACLRFANGALGTIEATTSAWPGSLKRLEIYGSGGSAVVEDEDIRKWEFVDATAEDEQLRNQYQSRNQTSGGAADPLAIDYSGHREQFRNIVEAIEDRAALAVDGPEARKSVEIICGIYESARRRQTVRLPLI